MKINRKCATIQSVMTNLRQLRFVALILVFIFSIGVSQQPAFAQSDVIWNAQYYNNAYLSEPATVTRQDMAIAFNWGASSPLQGINANNFSIRWGTNLYFEAGTYRFYILADDNVYLRVDNPSQPQIDTFTNPSVGQIITADVRLDAGIHHIQVDYREVTGDAFVYVMWEYLATTPTGPSFPVPQPLPYVGTPWTAQYYANADLAGIPALTLLENTPSHYWGAGSPGANIAVDNFSARWTSIQLLNAGNYQISVRADDGVRIYIDGLLYRDWWQGAPGVIYITMLNVAAGQHSFQIDYYEAGGIAFLEFAITPTFNTVPLIVNPPPVTMGTVVTALWLNVRNEPNANGNILIEIRQNETYPVIGRNADQSWWQINVNGTIGWVYWRFLAVTNAPLVPMVSATYGPSMNQPPLTGYFVTTLTTVNVRSAPGTNRAILAQIDPNIQVPLVGRTADNLWWQVNFSIITGWVSSRYVYLQPGTFWDAIPVIEYQQAYTAVRAP